MAFMYVLGYECLLVVCCRVVVSVCRIRYVCCCVLLLCFFFVQAEDGIRDLVRSRGLGDVYKRQEYSHEPEHMRHFRS